MLSVNKSLFAFLCVSHTTHRDTYTFVSKVDIRTVCLLISSTEKQGGGGGRGIRKIFYLVEFLIV
jgi:hypothetical protein